MTKEDREAFEEAVEIAVERLIRGDTVEYVRAFLRQLDYASVDFAIRTAQYRLPRHQGLSNVVELFPTPTT